MTGGLAVILGETVRKALFGDDEEGIGQTVRLGRVPFTVVGVLGSKGQGGFGQDRKRRGEDQDMFHGTSGNVHSVSGRSTPSVSSAEL